MATLTAGCGWGTASAPTPSYTCAAKATPILGCFVAIPGSTFTMGAQAADPAGKAYDPDARPDEGPPHEVTVAPFWIQQEEVTAAAFASCLAHGACRREQALEGPSSNLGRPDDIQQPANGITWEGAAAFCAWLGARLPTEAEWELAARGTDGRRWPWGNEPGCGPYATDAGVQRHGEQPIAPALGPDGKLHCVHRGTSHGDDHGPESPYGVRFMAGNVWEWVADWKGPYPSGPVSNPKGPATGTDRVQRGGGYTSEDPVELRTTVRGGLPPDQRFDDVGFRCAIDDPDRLPDPMVFPGDPP
jgi:formylglycine-generating enzyme required for sulfatase activity